MNNFFKPSFKLKENGKQFDLVLNPWSAKFLNTNMEKVAFVKRHLLVFSSFYIQINIWAVPMYIHEREKWSFLWLFLYYLNESALLHWEGVVISLFHRKNTWTILPITLTLPILTEPKMKYMTKKTWRIQMTFYIVFPGVPKHPLWSTTHTLKLNFGSAFSIT